MAMTQVTLVYIKDGKQRTMIRVMEEASVDEVIHVLDHLGI